MASRVRLHLAFDEEKHPRIPGGHHGGGRFIKKGLHVLVDGLGEGKVTGTATGGRVRVHTGSGAHLVPASKLSVAGGPRMRVTSGPSQLAARHRIASERHVPLASRPSPGHPVGVNDKIHAQIEEIRSLGLDKWPELNPRAGDVLGKNQWTGEPWKDTREKYLARDRNGVPLLDENGDAFYTPERARLHRRIISNALAGIPTQPEGQRIAMFYTGGSASGKTSVEDMTGNLAPRDSLKIDPDELKKMLDEYRILSGEKNPYSSSAAHEESSDLAKMLTREAYKRGVNLAFDGTGDNTRASFNKKIDAAVSKGYRVEAVLVDAPIDLAIARAYSRAFRPPKTNGPDDPGGNGRWVPLPEIERLHYGALDNHLMWRDDPRISRWRAFSTAINGRVVETAHGGGGRWDISDDPLAERLYAEKLSKHRSLSVSNVIRDSPLGAQHAAQVADLETYTRAAAKVRVRRSG